MDVRAFLRKLLKKNKEKISIKIFYLRIFVVGCCDQIFDAEFCWITNFGVTALVVDVADDDDEFVIIGWTSVTRFLDKNEDCFILLWSLLVDKSLVDDIKVWILGDVVPGGINVSNDDDDVDAVPVELACWGLNI